MLTDAEYIDLTIECFKKKGVEPPKNLLLKKMNLLEVDLCLDIVSDVLINEGFLEDWEPNSYGILLEDVMNSLLKIRYSLVD